MVHRSHFTGLLVVCIFTIVSTSMASHNDVCLCGNVLNKHKTDELRSSVQFPNGVENGSKNQINMIDLSMDETRRESTKKTR